MADCSSGLSLLQKMMASNKLLSMALEYLIITSSGYTVRVELKEITCMGLGYAVSLYVCHKTAVRMCIIIIIIIVKLVTVHL